MARVASCPNCNHELLVPDHAVEGAQATCPECSAHFLLKDISAREIPVLVVEDADSMRRPAGAGPAIAPTTDEFSTPAPLGNTYQPSPAQVPGTESQEEAAQRIDAWFRSAKTLSELPQDAGQHDAEAAEPASPAAWADADTATDSKHAPIQHEYVAPSSHDENNATLDMSADDPRLAELNSDFALDAASEALPNKPAWDDSQHMDELLADLENQPADEFVPSHSAIDQHAGESEHQPMWSPEVPLAMTPGVKERRHKRSLVATMLFTVVGGIVGLGLGYYALLWIQGPKIDFLDVAKYIPKAALPRSFRADAEPQQPSVPNLAVPVADATSTESSSSAVAKTDDQPAEKQAAFTEPATKRSAEPSATPAKSPTSSDDRYAVPAPKVESKLNEPAPFDAPGAKPIVSEPTPKQPEGLRLVNAPSFSSADVAVALQGAKDAQSKLVAGSLSDSKEVQQSKGRSFMALADLAQKATFATQLPGAGTSPLNPDVEQFFRQTLADKHTRDEVAQIAEKWLNHPNRPQNGIFFAGNVLRQEAKGGVTECTVDLGSGQPLTVIVPASDSAAQNSNRPVAVVGAIVEKPSKQIQGYSGTATKAVVANSLISLE